MRLLGFFLLFCFVMPVPAQCWWENGHRAVARVAAANLTPAARTRIAKLLGVADNPQDVAEAMAQASTWPDEIKKDRPETASWHYIDLTLQDKKTDFAVRCPENNCITARIRLFSAQLSAQKSTTDTNPISDLDALRFVIHFVADLVQPLHEISDADQGGNCEPLDPPLGKARNLHAYWDGFLPDTINPDDKSLAQILSKDIDGFGERRREGMAAGGEEDWAWESHEIAISAIYKRLKIPTEAAEFPTRCVDAPAAIKSDKLDISQSYTDSMLPVVRLQLERGGLRLARLLNESL